jgi:hypothetical protein
LQFGSKLDVFIDKNLTKYNKIVIISINSGLIYFVKVILFSFFELQNDAFFGYRNALFNDEILRHPKKRYSAFFIVFNWLFLK